MLEQTQSQPNHTSKTKVYFNEFVANALLDNISKKSASNLKKKKKMRWVFSFKYKKFRFRVNHKMKHKHNGTK